MKIKVLHYSSDWSLKWEIENIKDINKIQYNEIVNWWQSWFNIELWVKFDDLSYSYWDLVEFIIYNDKYKSWIHKFTGVIKWINRKVSKKEQYIRLKIDGLVSLLSDYKINKTYSWTLTSVIDTLITDFHSQKNISNEMLYLWTQILKNTISSTESINISTNGTFFQALEKIFWENREFFINSKWEIILLSEVVDIKYFSFNEINEIEMDDEGFIDILISWNTDFTLEVWQNIILENIKSELNLDWKKIKEIVFSSDKVLINAWKIINYKNL